MNNSAAQALKDDSGKIRYNLVPAEGLELVAKTMTFGAHKYKDRNWELDCEHSRRLDSAMRHIEADRLGERDDKETGLPHFAHAAAQLLMILSMRARGLGTDDLPSAEALKTNEGEKEYDLGRTVEIPANAVTKGMVLSVEGKPLTVLASRNAVSAVGPSHRAIYFAPEAEGRQHEPLRVPHNEPLLVYIIERD